jgi:hypothetical protein
VATDGPEDQTDLRPDATAGWHLGGGRQTKGLGAEAFHPQGRLDHVAKNSVDFRGAAEKPGAKGQYAEIAIHAGLICFNGPPGMDLDMQLELFEQALDELETDADLANQVLEITWDEEALQVRRYQLPVVEP